MRNDIIEEKDIVNVYFSHIEGEFNVKIIYKPTGEGDVWCLLRENGTPINIMRFELMELVKKHE